MKERNKYPNVESSIKKLKSSPAYRSHYIVYGCLIENNRLGLYATRYVHFLDVNFSANESNVIKCWELNSLQECFQPINNLYELKKYLQLLINEKKASSKDSSNVDYGNTLIVDKDGNTCSLSDKNGLAELDLKFEIPKPEISKPSQDFGFSM